ncbi:MAG: HK97 gp10 family phage protein [Hydrogenophaga sp.]|jgi:hypothetical protein|nr:HK97 gp10 family phage protein [Hydrogenophaga sp.]
MARRGSFTLDLRAFEKKFEDRTDALIRAAALDALGAIVQRTPVDTGRARANWQVTIGAPAGGTVTTLDPSGALARAKALGALASFKGGSSVFIVNNLPYILPLEYGSSKQAPAGMVRITLREWRGKVSAAAKGLR